MRRDVPTIRPTNPTPRGDAEWFAQSAGRTRATLRGANHQSAIRNYQLQAVYEYDVYGQVAASDPNHPNRFLFTGREFDTETGLYYYRARYYNASIGRFLQTDPIGYAVDLNLYRYCLNDPLRFTDASGATPSVTVNPWVPVGKEIDAYIGVIHDWTHPLVSPDAPLISFPWTWDQGGAPAQCGTWGINDFFNWYRYGWGQSVDLQLIGLLGDLERRVAGITLFKSAMLRKARALVREASAEGSSGKTYAEIKEFEYHFAATRPALALGVLTFDPLTVLGDSQYFSAAAWVTVTARTDDKGRVTGTYDWKVQIEFSMTDSFSDPMDFFDSTPGVVSEWSGCQPYTIFAHWWWVRSGTK